MYSNTARSNTTITTTTTVNKTIKGTVHPQIIFLKYVMLITVNTNFTIIIANCSWHHRYQEIIQITGAPPSRLHRMPDSKAGRRKVLWRHLTQESTQSTHRQQLAFPALLALSSMIPLSSKQLQSPSSRSVHSGSNWYGWMSVMV